MLNIDNLEVTVSPNKKILQGVNLCIQPGEVHAIMGPNGSGKSTLANVLAGSEVYNISKGSIQFLGQDLSAQSPEARAALGLFLAFQYPVEIPGVSNAQFLKAALNSIQKKKGMPELDAFDFMALLKDKMKALEMPNAFLSRAVNAGFSGGEKKRNEVLQMLILEPTLMVLDETDSGLDIDALKIVSRGINLLRSPKRSALIITHYRRLLDYIVPDYVHVQMGGKIVASGDKSLAVQLEEKGYAWLEEKAR